MTSYDCLVENQLWYLHEKPEQSCFAYQPWKRDQETYHRDGVPVFSQPKVPIVDPEYLHARKLLISCGSLAPETSDILGLEALLIPQERAIILHSNFS